MSAILCHTNVSEVVSKYPPKPVRNLTLVLGKFLVSLTWEDPVDYTEEGYTCTWAKTIVVRKQGGYPNDIHDGTVVVTTVERDKYKTTGYDDTGLTAGETYYYKVFTCNTDGVYGEPVEGTAIPVQYRIMTIEMNIVNDLPNIGGTYLDDAITMTDGISASEWTDFFGYKPCLFKDGVVVGYLNPNDYTKFEDGSVADITSGNSGDVMIEFPRHGLNISMRRDGDGMYAGYILTVSMTDEPNNSNFTYYAHQRGSTDKDYFYLGVYEAAMRYGYYNSQYTYAIRSLSGLQLTTYSSGKFTDTAGYPAMNDFYTGAKRNGSNYGIMGFYQWIYLQAMYLLQFKGKTDSENTIGSITYEMSARKTGNGNTAGLFSGNDDMIKIFGLENLWGNTSSFIYGFRVYNNHAYTTTDDNISISNFTDKGSVYTTSGFMSRPIGTNNLGFISGYSGSSSSTCFCDRSDVANSNEYRVGGSYKTGRNSDYYGHNGIFSVEPVDSSMSRSSTPTTSRLQYL